MSAAPLTLEALAAAFALPPGEPPRRVPKATLADNVPTIADRRLIETKLARLDWIAAINTATTGISAGSANGLSIDTINLLSAQTRGPMPERLAEIIHRAIPKPVILLQREEASNAGAALSLAPKRAAEREAGRVVTTALFDTDPLTADDSAFVCSLALPRLPTRDLAALYAGLIERVEALQAARTADRSFRIANGPDESQHWREVLAQVDSVSGQIATLSADIRKQRTLAGRVELGEKVRSLKEVLDSLRQRLK